MIRALADAWAQNPVAFWLLLGACGYLAVIGIRLSIIDIRSHRLPNRIVFPAYPAAGLLLCGAAAVQSDWNRLATVLLAALTLWAGYFALRFAYPEGMGFGDVKLAGVLGLYLGYPGWPYVLWGTFAAFLLGSLWGLGVILSRRGTVKSHLPFGPFMIAGTVLALLV